MNWEIGIDMYTLMCIKWMTNKNLLYKKYIYIFKYGLDISCDCRMIVNFLRCDSGIVVIQVNVLILRRFMLKYLRIMMSY